MEIKFGNNKNEIIENNIIVDKLTNKETENKWEINKDDNGLDNLIFIDNENKIILKPLKEIIKEKLLKELWIQQIKKKNKSNKKYFNENINWEYSNLIFKNKNNSKLQDFVQKLWNLNLETKHKMMEIAKNTSNKEASYNIKKKYENNKCLFCNEIETTEHFTSNCFKTIEIHDKSTIQIINHLRSELEIEVQDIKWWFNNNEQNKLNENEYDLKLGDIGLIPNYLISYLDQKNIKNLNKTIATIQIIILKNIYNLWKTRSERK